MTYLKNIKSAVVTSGAGLRLSFAYLLQVLKKRKQDVADPEFFETGIGTTTLQFPRETIPVPDNGRYKLHNEIDDCIVCDKCAKICPVDCIDIIPIRSPDVIGQTSDGTARRLYAEKFDIDMSKCMFCGLCTTVCPTECLTMTDEYDYSTFDILEHIFPFGNLSDQEVKEKKDIWEKHQAEKDAAATAKAAIDPSAKPRPSFKPKVAAKGTEAETSDKPKPKFKPRVVPKASKEGPDGTKPKPKFRPKVVPRSSSSESGETKPKPKIRPKVITKKPSEENIESKPKPIVKPKVIPKKPESDSSGGEERKQKPRPVFRPKIKPKKPPTDD